MRNNARKQVVNHSVKSRLKTLERIYADVVKNGKKEEAVLAYRNVTSAFDKAAKRGVIHKATANRKKSRLSVHLQKVR